MNRWKIPGEVEKEVRARDTHCVYCGILFGSTPGKGSLDSWEHIINDITRRTPENIARCCRSCNSSKGAKFLKDWLKSEYCLRRGIDSERVADVVKRALESHP
ncbi:MAG TPA: HNH endonuclease [Candidatus Aquilonibacter sp.]|jgi:5-methylcytosine-specific restriction endonuclease McrA|nr:HNH endonuclease [Candidatus Aquilonibacter sp.]